MVVLAEPLVRWDWIGDHLDDITSLLGEHVVLTVIPVLLGLMISLPLAVAVAGRPRLSTVLLSATSALYTIPSLAFFVLLLPFTGLERPTAIIPLTVYTLVILARNTLTGLEDISFNSLNSHDVVRHRLVGRIVAAYDEFESRDPADGAPAVGQGGRSHGPGHRPPRRGPQ